jgi:hypothetical protein
VALFQPGLASMLVSLWFVGDIRFPGLIDVVIRVELWYAALGIAFQGGEMEVRLRCPYLALGITPLGSGRNCGIRNVRSLN